MPLANPLLRHVLLLILLLLLEPVLAQKTVRVGVLTHRGEAATLRTWNPTAEYLTRALPAYRFVIEPLDFSEVEPRVRRGEVDFILVNSGIYVNMEVKHRVSRIVTMNNRNKDQTYNVFGGVVFTRSDRDDILSLEDLRGTAVTAVDEISLGGFQMAWREMREVGIEPYENLARLEFAGTHDKVVRRVLRGASDVGIIRTDILERMAGEGEVDLEEIRILNPQYAEDFPFARSTRLYPEWPFSKVQHTSKELAQSVTVALLQMPHDHPAAILGNYAGWTVPMEYQPVHELLRELRLPPYEGLGRFTLIDAVKRYWYWIVTVLVFLLFMLVMTVWVMRLNRELAKSKSSLEYRHKLILDSVCDGIYGVDTSGNSTFVNRAMERLTGWDAEEVIGRNQHELLHHTRADGSHYPGSECPVYQTYKDNAPRFIDDDIFWRKDGSNFPVEYSATPIRDDKGATVGSVVVFRDITERKRAQEEFQQYQNELTHFARLSTMGEMASGIAHELNQPLTAISTNARACVRLVDSGRAGIQQTSDVLEKIANQAERAGQIIHQLRRFARKEEPEKLPVPVNSMVRGVAVMIEPMARRESVGFRMELNEEELVVLAQRIQIEQVILNLANNAIEAMRDMPRDRRALVIRSRRMNDTHVEVRVVDTGPGISEGIRGQLFNPFITSKAEGMGLGLSISHNIIESHGGSLSADSIAGKGAVFRFTLPLYQE